MKTDAEDALKNIENKVISKNHSTAIRLPEYDKNIRIKFDDVNKRRNHKNQAFGIKKTYLDEYTNGVLHKDSIAAKNKYGSKATEHMVQVDHVVPIKQVYNRTKHNAFIDNNDRKEIANHSKNYAITNAKINVQKKDKSNFKVSKDKNLSKSTKRNLLVKQFNAEVAVNTEMVKRTVYSANKIGLSTAKNTVLECSPIIIGSNMINVINGEKDIDEAILQIGLDSVELGVKAYATEISSKAIESTINHATSKMVSKEAGTAITKFVDNGGVMEVLQLCTEVGSTLKKYINDEITAVEMIDELGEKGCGFVVAGVGKVGGDFIGALIGGTLGTILAPGTGTAVGAFLGGKIGGYIGEFAGYMVGTAIYRETKDMLGKLDGEKYVRARHMYDSVTKRLEKYEKELIILLNEIHMEHSQKIYEGFIGMKEGIINNNLEQLTNSMEIVCNEYNIDVRFKTRQEFDRFMEDKNAVFIL